MTVADEDEQPVGRTWATRLEGAALVVLIGTLAWAPFPLGSNRPWSWSLLSILVAASWVLWSVAQIVSPTRVSWRFYLVPFCLFLLPLLWAVVQVCPAIPASWGHPVWQMASDALHVKLSPLISIDPWGTVTEIMKLATYLMAGILTVFLCQRSARANILFMAVLIIITLYAVYGVAIALLHFTQTEIFYDGWVNGGNVNGPFVSRNNFATYLGMGVCLAAIHVFPSAGRHIVSGRGARQYFLSLLQYVFGAGVWNILALLVSFSVLVATGSRAGFIATLCGVVAILLLASPLAKRGTSRWATAGVIALLVGGCLLFFMNGAFLQDRINDLAAAGGKDDVRIALWSATRRMISNAPWLGLGLGSYQLAYPLYADQIMPFVLDKAHNDYLEFAAGVGLPAALVWWTGLAWCIFCCARAVFVRRRSQIYPLAAAGVGVLVAFHSAFDFSLQIPAVALTFSVILGMGMAQARPSRDS